MLTIIYTLFIVTFIVAILTIVNLKVNNGYYKRPYNDLPPYICGICLILLLFFSIGMGTGFIEEHSIKDIENKLTESIYVSESEVLYPEDVVLLAAEHNVALDNDNLTAAIRELATVKYLAKFDKYYGLYMLILVVVGLWCTALTVLNCKLLGVKLFEKKYTEEVTQ